MFSFDGKKVSVGFDLLQVTICNVARWQCINIKTDILQTNCANIFYTIYNKKHLQSANLHHT